MTDRRNIFQKRSGHAELLRSIWHRTSIKPDPSEYLRMTIAFAALAASGCSFQVSVLKKPETAQAPASAAKAPEALMARTTVEVPKEAQLVAEGNDPVRVAPDGPGTVYVFSRDDRHVSLQYDLLRGETFMLTPGEKRTAFTADRHSGEPGKGTVPPSKGGYEVYFLRKGFSATSTAPAPVP